VISKSIFQFIHPSSKETFNQLFREGLDGQSKGEINLVAGKKIFPVYISLTSLYPTLPTVGMIVTDLSEKKTHEKNLKQSEDKFTKLFEASPLPLVLCEIPSGKIVEANEVYFETIGYTREESIGKDSIELNLLENETRQKIWNRILEHAAIKNIEVEIRRKNGKLIPVLFSSERIKMGDSEFLLSALIDIADRKQSERQIAEKNVQLEKMNKELEAFTYVSSHDLQEPLRKIQIFASHILEKEKQNLSDTGKDYFHRMQDAALRMQTLINELLNFSRLVNAERAFEYADLRDLVADVKTELKEVIEEKKATLTETGLGRIKIIPFQFRQLVYNLISNSLKFSRPGIPMVITIESRIAEGKDCSERLLPDIKYHHLTFTDNGIGFEKHFAEKIFEVFQKLHGKDEYPGTGIGLAIVKKVVENHHGLITAKSEPGEGARFDVYIPV
jgi:PAS domain S-box-containing protein